MAAVAQKGTGMAGALAKDPKNKPMQRLSPGVYRSAGGGLVTQGGRSLPRPQQQMRPAPPQMQQPAKRPPPAPLPNNTNPSSIVSGITGNPENGFPYENTPHYSRTPQYNWGGQNNYEPWSGNNFDNFPSWIGTNPSLAQRYNPNQMQFQQYNAATQAASQAAMDNQRNAYSQDMQSQQSQQPQQPQQPQMPGLQMRYGMRGNPNGGY